VTVEQNKAVVRRLFDEVYNAKKVDVIDELMSADFVDHDQAEGMDNGREGLKQFIGLVAVVFPDNRLTMDDVVAEGDKVVARWTSYNTHTGGEFFGIPPSGNKAVFTGTTIYRVVNGKIAELWYDADVMGLFAQLGAPSPVG
jgi:predicted ester cyclase